MTLRQLIADWLFPPMPVPEEEERAFLRAPPARRPPSITLPGPSNGGSYGQDATAKSNGWTGTLSTVLSEWYARQGFIGHQMAAILAQHWLIDRACSLPGKDAIRQGFTVVLEGTDRDDAHVQKGLAPWRVHSQLEEFVRFGRIYGIRLALFKVRYADPRAYEMPFNPDAVCPGSFEGIVQVDPYWASPVLSERGTSDPGCEGFYEPTWWQIGGRKYHKSHLVIFRTGEVGDVLKPTYLYGGVPVPQRIMERVYAAETSANEAPKLANSKRLTVWSTDLDRLMANQDQATEALNAFAVYRDNYGIKVADLGDSMSQFDTSLSGLDTLIAGQYSIVAAAAGVPVTKLMGSSPKGMDATGEFEARSYHEELESIQTLDLTPFLDRLLLILLRSHFEPLWGVPPGTVTATVVWKPLDSPTAKEEAEINKLKADTDAVLAGTGAIDGNDVRDRLRADKASGYAGIVDTPEAEALAALEAATEALRVTSD